MSKFFYKIIFWQKVEREGVKDEFLDDLSSKICVYRDYTFNVIPICTASLSINSLIQFVDVKFYSWGCHFQSLQLHGFVKNSSGGREVNLINTLSKINLSKIG